jgi:hypothetical protein
MGKRTASRADRLIDAAQSTGEPLEALHRDLLLLELAKVGIKAITRISSS